MGIVTVNVSVTQAPIPSVLQQIGAFISQGGTTLAAGTKTLLRVVGDLAAHLAPAKALATLTWSGSVVTANAAANHGITVGQSVMMTIAGVTPAGYNGTFLCTATDADSFTYPLVANPGAETVPGTYTPVSVNDVTRMNKTFFDQGGQQAVYVLELGIGSAAAGVTALGTFITAHPGEIYSYLTPATWSDESTFETFANGFTSLTSQTYFFATFDLANFDSFTAIKSVSGLVPAPAAAATEWSMSAEFFKTLNYKPSSTNKVTPLAYSYLLGVTNYPTQGNAGELQAILDAKVNYVGTGAEGGISNKVLFNGTMLDGRDFTYWYSIDWVQITLGTDVANAVINGSNNPQNPLYYNQNGIDRLQAVISGTMGRGVTFGMVFGAPIQVAMDPADFVAAVEAGTFAGQTAINAQPFIAYSAANPSDYANGLYSGFQVAFTPNRGFKQIVIGVNVTDFVTA